MAANPVRGCHVYRQCAHKPFFLFFVGAALDLAYHLSRKLRFNPCAPKTTPRRAAEKQNQEHIVVGAFYKHGTPQQPAKGAQFVGASPTRRIRRFTTERPGACPAARLEGIEQSWHRTDGPK